MNKMPNTTTNQDYKRNKSGSVKSKGFKMYNYPDDSNNMYANEYSCSAQNSQFTFGATPDSRLSDRGHSGTNSANKSLNQEKEIMYSMRDIIKQNKMRSKQRKSSVSEKHRRNSSKCSKKGKKQSKKKSNRHHTPSINGYFKMPSTTTNQDRYHMKVSFCLLMKIFIGVFYS